MLDTINATILELAGQPWVYAAVGFLAIFDAFFPPLPSDSVIVALAALGSGINLWLLGVVGAVCAVIGDSMMFAIGRRVGTDRFAWQRRPRTARGIAWAGREVDRRGGALILTSRYIPVGRVAVMLTCGATGMSWRRFLAFDAIACAAWSGWAVLLGTVAGELLGGRPLIAAVVGVVVALVLGFVIDRVVSRLHDAPAAAAAAAAAEEDQPEHATV